ncbi:MauE/DoxX family redox-associated membrane protein [Oryzobacter telluris]|uniref:MauE/DoxX family redox-associated membrane protein n=1 Tax=Oryzobacter telluris TaxID=3149179 RepID=UPI00370D3D30
MPSPLLLPVLTCAVVLLVSGVAKLRDPASVDRAFTSLEVPAPLSGSLVRRVVPWAEVLLGAALLVTSGILLALAATVTLLLFLAYLVLVARAVRRPEPVDCGCFGALGDDRVTRVTVWRNVVLVAAALLAVYAGLTGVGLVLVLDDGSTWALLALAALTVLAAVLVTHRSAEAAPGTDPLTDADGEYVRTPIPRAQVITEDGKVALLSERAKYGAHLLVFLSPGCGSCMAIGPLVPGWAAELEPLVVKAVIQGDETSLIASLEVLQGQAWFDPFSIARLAFEVATPGAVLLGTDGHLAGGPVQGQEDVLAFVDELREHLRASAVGGATQA